ncbi:extracellular solute-binding protein [Paenibacillus contaminans]|uniref:ABC transporter substrate-binding protein n=1 Tax=Paenibacillus contaminans TaxID=450362 RepID=A0A329MQ55_9BACL|nr:extracellular solute-binding protein [Paenibacillus contaminans]RAV20873.1 ABC transporter substrate-binding protein [Paenibacillus contaminans]
MNGNKNKMNEKKWIAVMATSALAIGALAGCGGSASEPSAPPASASPGKEAASKEEVKYPASLTYWVAMNAGVAGTMKSFAEMEVYKQLEKITGTKVEFQHPPVGQDKEQLNLLLASGNLPDVIEYQWTIAPKGPDNAINEKKIIRLNELIERHAPNLSKLLKDNPEFKKLITTDEGNIYVMPYLNPDESVRVFNGPAMRQDWLDKLGLKVPATLKEWEEVLIAFRDKDPNGNGKKDEIPLLFDPKVAEVGHAFIGAYGITTTFYADGGKIKFGPTDPKFKEYLTLLNRWYKEGLIDKDFATIDQKLKDAKMTEGLVGSMAMNVGYGIGTYTTAVTKVNPSFKLVGTPYPVLEPGGKSIGQMDTAFAGRGAAISAQTKNPEQIVKWMDYAYGEAGSLLFNFGTENVSYKLENGYPKLTELMTNNPDKLTLAQAVTKYTHGTFSGPYVYDKRLAEQYSIVMPEQKQASAVWTKADHAKLLPLISQTAEESGKLSSLMNDINTYYQEMFNKFVMGLEPLSSFDKYVETINKMGVDEAIKLKQAALDRYNKR